MIVRRPCKHCLYELGLLSFVGGSSLINQQISAAFLDTCMYLEAEDCLSPETLNGTVQEVLVAATSSRRAPWSSLPPLPPPSPPPP